MDQFHPSNFKRPLAMQMLNGIGDSLLIRPSIKALIKIFPNLSFLHRANNFWDEIIFRDFKFSCTKSIQITKNEENKSKFSHQKFQEKLEDFDLLISFNSWIDQNFHSALNSLEGQNITTIGRYAPYDIIVAPTHQHIFDQHFEIPQVFYPELTLDDFVSPPNFGTETEQNALNALAEKLPVNDGPLLTVQTQTDQNKRWNRAKFHDVFHALLDRKPTLSIAVVDKSKKEPDEKLTHNRIGYFPNNPLAVSLEIVRQSDYFLGIDSLMLHMADITKIPGVGLFVDTDYRKWGFKFSDGIHIEGRQIEPGTVVESLLKITSE